MRDLLRAERVLSLFTSADRAQAIAGDLTEEHQHRQPVTFWMDVARTTAALWRTRVTDAPLRAVALAVAACVGFAGPALLGLASVFLFPQHVHSPAAWVPLAVCWWGGALFTGILLVRVAPRDGLAVSATLALAVQTGLLAALTDSLWLEPSPIALVPCYVVGLLVAPLVVVGAVVQRRRIVRNSLTLEE